MFSSISAAEISQEKQLEIIENYMYVTGQLTKAQSTAFREQNELTKLPIKCGMSAVRDFKLNYDKLSSQILKSTGVQAHSRPDYLTKSFASPSGKFLIHYETSGPYAVYTELPGGAMGYVDSVARIMDEVYDHEVTVLGYPEPIHDSFYAAGGDEKYDVYLVDLPDEFYGLTYSDSVLYNSDSTVITSTGYLELDKDYQGLSRYKNRPLDAVRVTAAHEFFHMIQFGIDFTESEVVSSIIAGPTWMEMSAVWMEEEVYDDINDYYIYLPFFFNSPMSSIQQFNTFSDLHPYGSVVFPLFLSQKFDRNIIKSIWTKCGEYGAGPNFLEVTGEVIDSASLGTETFESAFSEFALWNYFTGSRAGLAPAGIGYSERRSYIDEFSENPAVTEIRVENNFPFTVLGTSNNAYNPAHNAAFYLTLRNIDHLIPDYACVDSTAVIDTTYWICNNGAFPTCTDSTEVTAGDVFDVVHIDSSFVCNDSLEVIKFFLALDDQDFFHPWGLSIVYEYKYFYDSLDVDSLILPNGAALGMNIPKPSEYNAMTFIFTPASSYRQLYIKKNYEVKFGVFSSSDTTAVDSVITHKINPSELFFPYPNPAVIADMSSKKINFSFKLPTDSTYLAESTNPSQTDTILIDISTIETFMIVDIFNLNGEHIRTIEKTAENKIDVDNVLFSAEWDLKNQSGADVSSGVYFAYARLYVGDIDGTLLAEEKTKLAVIR